MNKKDNIMKKIRATFTIGDFMLDELNSVSQELGQKKSHIVEQALSLYFDMVDTRIADSRLDKLDKGEEILAPSDTVFDTTHV